MTAFSYAYLRQNDLERCSDFYNLEYALIGRPKNQPNTLIETGVLLSKGDLQANIMNALAGTPCENVLGGERICMHKDGVCASFPEDLLLQEMGVTTYIGSGLLSPEGNLLGILVFMSERPIHTDDSIFTVLDFVASRAGMELEREDLNHQLKAKSLEESHEKRLAALGQLVNGVAHDFNNLLSGILGHAELLEPKLGDNESTQPHVDGMLSSIMRAENLTSQLTDDSNPQANYNLSANVRKLFDEVRQLVNPTFGEQRAVHSDISPELKIKMDESHLQQVFLNLIINARDAMPNGGQLTITAASDPTDPAFAKITVVDTGTGISEPDQARIFDPFFTTKAVGEGNGLGLSSVYSIVQTYGGSITVQSHPGNTAFTILLPVAKEGKPRVQQLA